MYQMYLIIQNKEISIPVLPETLTIESSGKNESVEVLKLGEVYLLKKKGLREISWESFLPAYDDPHVTGKWSLPIEIVKAIQEARDSEKPIRLLLLGTDLDINRQFGIDDFSYEERGGEVGDIYYSISLREWKDYSPKKIILPPAPSKPAQTTQPVRSGEPAKPRTYTVVRGDSLWKIAKKYYGNGAQYTKIFNANRDKIKNPNLIYPGQVLVIP